MRTFNLQRDDDETGISGTGVVAQGVEFDDGTVAMKWLTETASLGYYNSIDELIQIHGHEGRTYAQFTNDIERVEGYQRGYRNATTHHFGEIRHLLNELEDDR